MVIRKQANASNAAPCGICKSQPFKYICPRCNLRYCSLTCYKDKSHIQCTESFYKSSVMSELKASPSSTPQDRQKMLGILDRFEKQAIAQEELLNSPGNHPSIALDNHSLPGEPSGARKTLSAKERNDILRKAIEEEKLEAQGDDEPEELDDDEKAALEQMLEQEYRDLVNRFAGVDLDKESFDTLWAKLTPEEQQEFQEKFMLSGRDLGDPELDEGSEDVSEEEIDTDDRKERQAAKELLKEMDETMKRGEMYSETKKAKAGSSHDHPLLANLDAEDLKAIRDAEISELIPVWRPWWEEEAEETGQLKKMVVTEVPGDQAEISKTAAVSSILNNNAKSSTPHKEPQSSAIPTSTHTVLESYVLDEEAMLRPHRSLVQDMEDVSKEEQAITPMVKEPHPSFIYHVVGLLFAYAATIRVFNGDLKEEPEQVLSYIFDLCPFFAPPPPSTGSKTSTSKPSLQAPAQLVDVQDFETTLAVMQRSSLDSKLWKGDISRLEMLALLLRDLTLILAKPSRCLFSIRELKQVFTSCMESKTSQAPGDRTRQHRLFPKTVLHRLLKKLEFYESFMLSKNLIQQSDRLDRVRTEVVLSGIQVRQEMVGWAKELESVTRVTSEASSATQHQQLPSSSSPSKRVLIEEIA
ncbi:hypothetical protein MVEG_04645 [Podila verticillata NRRL 6337]|nr:MAG: hypothetical protein BYD32DRAFT_483897 [Podila humilis]KFH69841.1 hypothetical protein MVEG_04645 [Podila verticillata NRRL 6337]